MDSNPVHHWDDLADSLPGRPHHVRLRVRAGDTEEASVEGGFAVRHQPCGERDLHADSIRAAELAAGSVGHYDRLGHNYLYVLRHLEASQMGCGVAGAVFRVGLDCDRAAIVNHLEQLVAMTESPSTTEIRLGLCCIFREQPIKFRNTTVKAIGGMNRDAALAKLSGLCMANAEALLASLQFCAKNGIGCFRINSQILPVKTHSILLSMPLAQPTII